MRNSPEFKLWLQVMIQGLWDLSAALDCAASGIPCDEIDLGELRDWIFEARGLGSFEWMCEMIDVDPARAREVIREYWIQRLDGERAISLEFRRIPVTNGRMRRQVARRRAGRIRRPAAPMVAAAAVEA